MEWALTTAAFIAVALLGVCAGVFVTLVSYGGTLKLKKAMAALEALETCRRQSAKALRLLDPQEKLRELRAVDPQNGPDA